jgi:hypothetical protein
MPAPFPFSGQNGFLGQVGEPAPSAKIIERLSNSQWTPHERVMSYASVAEESDFPIFKVLYALTAFVTAHFSCCNVRWWGNPSSALKKSSAEVRAAMLASIAPTTKEGLEKYLGSGMVKGIGRKRSVAPL